MPVRLILPLFRQISICINNSHIADIEVSQQDDDQCSKLRIGKEASTTNAGPTAEWKESARS